MIDRLLAFIPSWRTAAISLLAGIAIGTWDGFKLGQWWYQAKVADRDKIIAADHLREAQADLAAANAKIDADSLARRSAATAAIAAVKRAADLETILREIKDAPSTDDGPVSPVLRRTVERLRRDAAAARNPTGAPGDPGQPALVPVAAPGQ